MTQFAKEPNIKLIPSDPMTNTILIIYCVSSTGASVPYKSVWRKVHPKRNKIEQIKYHNGSSYRCSPLDIDYFIQATIYFKHQNTQISRIVQSNVVKVSRQLKQKRYLSKEPIAGRIIIQQISLQMRFFVKDQALHINPIDPNFQTLTHSILISDLLFETEGNQMNFKVMFKNKFEEFLHFITPLIGWKPLASSHEILIQFGSDLNRDIILFQINEVLQPSFKPEFSVLHFPTARHYGDKNGKITARQQKNISKSPNKSQTSASALNENKDRIARKGKFHGMKNSFTGVSDHDRKKQFASQIPITPPVKTEQSKDKLKEREYLNVFEDEDLQFLNASIPSTPIPAALTKSKAPTNIENQVGNDGPSINLRGSFEELEKSFNSNLNQEAIDKVFGMQDSDINKKMQEEMNYLKKQNSQLKKQLEKMNQISKESNSIKRKYLEMKEEVNRLEMQKKVILTDKLRCEVNWHKQIQEKQSLKKQLEQLRELTKQNTSMTQKQRSIKSNSFHQPAGYDRFHDNREISRDIGRSNHSYLH